MIKQAWNTSLAHYIYRCSAVLTRMQIYVDLSLAPSRCSSGFDSDGCVQASDSCKLGAILSFRPLIKTPRWFKCHKRAALNFRRKKILHHSQHLHSFNFFFFFCILLSLSVSPVRHLSRRFVEFVACLAISSNRLYSTQNHC